MSTSISVNAIIDGFPTPYLLKRPGELDYTEIKDIHRLLTVNVTSANSSLGGGQNRYLGLFLLPTQYALIGATLFFRPP